MSRCERFLHLKYPFLLLYVLWSMKYWLMYILFVGMFISCSDVHMDMKNFPKSKQLIAEKIPVHEIFSPDFVTKSGDYFVISSSLSDSTLFLYEIPSLTFRKATGVKGNGPDEIETFPMFCHTLDDDFLYVRGYSPFTIKKIDLDEGAKFNFMDEYELDGDDEYNFMNIVNDSLLIYYSSNQLAITKYDLKNKMKLGKVELEKDNHHESYYYSNRGIVSANDSFVVYPYLYQKKIDIYDINDFKLVRSLGDESRSSSVSVSDKANITYHYFNVYAGKHYFYALYVGHKEEDEDFLDRTLEVYDYSGNPVIRYTFDIVPFYFAVDEQNGYIYATNSNYEDYLLRYKL